MCNDKVLLEEARMELHVLWGTFLSVGESVTRLIEVADIDADEDVGEALARTVDALEQLQRALESLTEEF